MREMQSQSLDEILGDFKTDEATDDVGRRDRRAVTIWLPPEDWARYDRLQKTSRKRFGKKAREALLALIRIAEAKAS